MSGAWILVVLLVVMSVFLITVQVIAKHRDHRIFAPKDVLPHLKQENTANHTE